MKIETKYNVWDKTYIMNNNKVLELTIDQTNITLTKFNHGADKITITYSMKYWDKDYNEDQIVPTKQELLDSL